MNSGALTYCLRIRSRGVIELTSGEKRICAGDKRNKLLGVQRRARYLLLLSAGVVYKSNQEKWYELEKS